MAEDQVELQNLEGQAEEAGVAVEADLQELQNLVLELTDERDQLKDQLLRAMADFQNYKRRNQQELNQFRAFATEALVRELLPVLDNFERSLDHLQAGANVDKVIEGVHAVERQLRQVLELQNVTRVASVGELFDPVHHEALGMDENTPHPEGHVSAEIEPGYRMGDKIIRPAKVRISSKRSG